MAVRVDRGIAGAIRDNPGGIVVQVRHASDLRRASEALRGARDEISALDGGWESAPNLGPGDRNGPTYVSGVAETPAGPALYVDGGFTPEDLLATIPDIVVRHLRVAGVGNAVVASADPRDSLYHLGELAAQVALVLFPPPPTYPEMVRGRRPRIEQRWLDRACEWVIEGLDREETIWAESLVRFPVRVDDAATLFERLPCKGMVKVVCGDPSTRIRAVHANFISGQLAIGAGGPGATDEDLLATIRSLSDLARPFAAEVAYGYISVHPSFRMLQAVPYPTDWCWNGGAAPEQLWNLCDELVLDAFPFQILGPGHLARLQDAGVDLNHQTQLDQRVELLSDGRVGLTIGAPAAWLIDDPARVMATVAPGDIGRQRRNAQLQVAAQQVLRPCLLSRDEARSLERRRARRESGLDSAEDQL